MFDVDEYFARPGYRYVDASVATKPISMEIKGRFPHQIHNILPVTNSIGWLGNGYRRYGRARAVYDEERIVCASVVSDWLEKGRLMDGGEVAEIDALFQRFLRLHDAVVAGTSAASDPGVRENSIAVSISEPDKLFLTYESRNNKNQPGFCEGIELSIALGGEPLIHRCNSFQLHTAPAGVYRRPDSNKPCSLEDHYLASELQNVASCFASRFAESFWRVPTPPSSEVPAQ